MSLALIAFSWLLFLVTTSLPTVLKTLQIKLFKFYIETPKNWDANLSESSSTKVETESL